MNELLIILVCYNEDVNKIEYLKALKDVDILIYDNSLQRQNVEGRYHYIHDNSNPGVSKAYNSGIQLARELNKKYVLLLDYDTKFCLEYFEQFLGLVKKYGEDYIYAPIIYGNEKIYSPFIETSIRNCAIPYDQFQYNERLGLEGKSLINSGLLIPLKVIDTIGTFNENIKLDFSDIYFISKYKTYKNEVILVNVRIEHSLSGDEGVNKEKELSRFRYYCNGAREFGESSGIRRKLRRYVFFRMVRLIVKYRTLKPIVVVKDYYFGELTA